jgi:4-hydroxybenzoate polyprenyltransferase
MKRTRVRPLPSKRVGVAEALIFGVLSGTSGVALLYTVNNPVCAALGTVGITQLYTTVCSMLHTVIITIVHILIYVIFTSLHYTSHLKVLIHRSLQHCLVCWTLHSL